MTTLRDVSLAAGVSVATAGRVLRRDPALVVREETRARVVAAAADLGYRPNGIASALRTRRTGTIALLLPDPQNFMWSEMVRGVERAAAARNNLVVVADAHGPTLDADQYGRLILEGRVDGALVAFATVTDDLVAQMSARGLPIVPINSRSDVVSGSATMDDEAGSRLAVNTLVGLGHRRIAFIAGRADTDVGRRRERGYRHAMLANGLPIREEWVRSGGFTEAGAKAATRAIMTSGTEPRPTAVYMSSFRSALGGLQALAEVGLSVPADLSVITMDDHMIADFVHPKLTAIRMPMYQMGEAGANLLLDAIEGRALRHVVADLAPLLMTRDSTIPATNPDSG